MPDVPMVACDGCGERKVPATRLAAAAGLGRYGRYTPKRQVLCDDCQEQRTARRAAEQGMTVEEYRAHIRRLRTPSRPAIYDL